MVLEFIHYHDQMSISNIIKGDLPMYDSMVLEVYMINLEDMAETTVKEELI